MGSNCHNPAVVRRGWRNCEASFKLLAFNEFCSLIRVACYVFLIFLPVLVLSLLLAFNRAKVVTESQPRIARLLAIQGTLKRVPFSSTEDTSSTEDSRKIQTRVPPRENKSCKRAERKWQPCL